MGFSEDKPNITYEVEVRAVNIAGSGPWSASLTITTPPPAPSAAEEAGDGRILVTWQAPNDSGVSITAYDLRYIRSDVPNKVDANWTLQEDIWSSGALQYDLSGLTNGVEYDVQVRAVNVFGDGPRVFRLSHPLTLSVALSP